MKILPAALLLSLAGFSAGQVCLQPDVLGYQCKNAAGGLTLHWGMLADGSAINFHLEVAEGTGWFGVGWNSQQQMIGSTVVIADKSANVNRYTLPAKVAAEIQATKTDIATVGTLSTPTPTVTTANGKTVLTFTRSREATEAPFRYAYIVMARHDTSEVIVKHTEKYIFAVDFLKSIVILNPKTDAPAVSLHPKVSVPVDDMHFTSNVVLTGVGATKTYLFSTAYVNSMHATLGDTESGNDLIKCLKQCDAAQHAEWKDGTCSACAVAPASRNVEVLFNAGQRIYFQGRSKKTLEELTAAHTAAVTAATAASIAGGEPNTVVAFSTSSAVVETPQPPPVLIYPSVPMDYDDDDDTAGTAGIAVAGVLSAFIVGFLIYLTVQANCKKEEEEEEEEEKSSSSSSAASSEKA